MTSPTLYEIAHTVAGRTIVFAYSARRTKACLAAEARTIGGFILSHLSDEENPDAIYDRRMGWQFGPVRVHFTGGTQKTPSGHPTHA